MGWIWSFRGRGEKGEHEWFVMKMKRYVKQIVSRLSTNTHESLPLLVYVLLSTLTSHVFIQAQIVIPGLIRWRLGGCQSALFQVNIFNYVRSLLLELGFWPDFCSQIARSPRTLVCGTRR